MPEKAVIRLIVLIILIPVNRLSSRWISGIMYKAAGKTKEQFKEHLIRTNTSIDQHNSFYSWMNKTAIDPPKFRRFYRFYQLCTLPNIVVVNFAVIGLFAQALDKPLDFATIALLILPVVLVIAKVVYYKNER